MAQAIDRAQRFLRAPKALGGLSLPRYEGITLPTKPHKPTKNELKLLKDLHLSESHNVTVMIGTPPCYEIIIGKEGRGLIKILQIPFSEFASQLDNSLSVLLCYPRLWKGRSERRIQANNLKLLLPDMEDRKSVV